MARKIHTKSRAGCNECKRRHLKCDEGRPVCKRCIASERSCLYAPPATQAGDGHHRSATEGVGQAQLSTVQNNNMLEPSPTVTTIQPPSAPCFRPDIDLIELFHLFTTSTCETIAIGVAHVDIYRQTILDRVFTQHFLLDEMLAVAACHMSLKRPARAAFYRDIASQQQARALAGFNQLLSDVNESNCLDILLFSHLVALHVFWDTFTPAETNFSTFLDKLVACIRMLRGINVIILTWWDTLVAHPIGAIILQADEQQNTPKGSLQECEPLRAMVDDADLSTSSINTCHESLNRLQLYFDNENVLETAAGSTHKIFSWLVTASEEYLDLLEQRRPEALVLLAYFAVLLHRRNKSWAIGTAGPRLLGHISSYLGKRWNPWLEWPTRMMAA